MTEVRIYYVEYFEGQVKGRPETRRSIAPVSGQTYNARMVYENAMQSFMNIFGTSRENIEIFSVDLKDELTLKQQQQLL